MNCRRCTYLGAYHEHEYEENPCSLLCVWERPSLQAPFRLPYQAADVGCLERLLLVCPCAGIHMLEQSGYIPYVLSVHRPMIHRAYRLDVGGYGVPTAVPLPEVVFESLQYGRAQPAHGHRLPFGECRECIHR